ncbi:tyrosine-type recombinase/integrase [Lelliottia sp. JS-SCA-14]|uniref:phage integrase n=1 Tax=Lelliottia sp. JS-SCA-14 TaxID=3110110 RepID=UPI002D782CB0|nr:tyrosine-type recombinase/integrase [Lelliottia sp. JS-SCA-14]
MTISKLPDGRYLVDVRPQGRDGKRLRKRFSTKSEAQQYERWAVASFHNKDWQERPADRRPLSELIDIWYQLKGQMMKSASNTHNKLKAIDERLGFPRADKIDKKMIANYRASRFEAGRKANTINREISAVCAVFGALIESGHYHGKNPFSELKKMKITQTEMGFLSKAEISALLSLLPIGEKLAAELSLSTGARWGEVMKLTSTRIAHSRVTFLDTKNGKNRTVPISQRLESELQKRPSGLVFSGVDYSLIREALKEAAPNLPKGQAVHALRHTFASHFVMNGGNILALQKILGHATIQQTMVYAHLAPDFLQEAIQFNPLSESFHHD